ncbi:MAG: M14 family metallopeptidase [Gemmatimonadetes bacterium]|nr:M14 family metallopeptidase [Gemmatimonadota bacterium]
MTRICVVTCSILFSTILPPQAMGQAGDPANPNWEKFHTTADAYALLRGWAGMFPRLTTLYSIGETLEGTPLMVLEITNKDTGPADEKPGYYYDGNIHASEFTGAEVALHFAWYVLSRYGNDPRITRLLDTRTLYVRPKFNPDGADIALTTPNSLRSTPRPYDEDRDGLLDEDPRDDLDGDGAMTQMRVPNPNGLWRISPSDNRVMVRRGDGEMEGDFYDLLSEGIDNDGDGYFNEDGIGGIDMNRNFPRNWGLEAEQRGAGPYPLSEPETRATIEFINGHRNITGVFHGHTSGGFVYRLPSTTSWDDFNSADQNLIVELSRKYEQTTGQPARASYTNPRVHRHGTLISWSYWDFGVVGFVPEFWGGFGRDYDGNGRVTSDERFRWNEEELNGAGFAEWTAYDHPQLGRVEIGGWRSKFTRSNPPPHLLKGEVELYIPWMLYLAEASPRVVIRDFSTSRVSGDVYKVTVVVENEGYLPTNITQRAVDLEIAVPVRAVVELTGAELVTGEARTTLGHLNGSRDTQGQRGTFESRRTLEYVVRVTDAQAAFGITILSEKGGRTRRDILLGLREEGGERRR